MAKQIGTMTVYEDYDVETCGETASNYTITRVHAGTYPVYAAGNKMWAEMDGSLIKSHYVNRVLTASSVRDEEFEKGERPRKHIWSWNSLGHDNFSAPRELTICGHEGRKLELDGYVLRAEVSEGKFYAHGAPMIRYYIQERPEEGQ